MGALVWCFFSFRGRLKRTEFALGFAVVLLLGFALYRMMFHHLAAGGPVSFTLRPGETRPLTSQALAQLFQTLVVLWPAIALQFKRLHDMGHSGWLLTGAVLVTASVTMISPILGGVINTAFLLWLMLMPGKAHES